MKKYYYNILTALLAISMLFIACKEGEYNDLSVIEVDYVKGSTSYIVTVKAVADFQGFNSYGDVIATSSFNNGFLITLPKVLSDKYLHTDESEALSNPKAKLGNIVLLAYNDKDVVIGIFMLKGENGNISIENAQHIYADRKCSLKGEIGMGFFAANYNCSFKKGWNIAYLIDEHSGTITFTTQKPSDINLNWEFFSFELENNTSLNNLGL